ncbi:MAG: hypothetical protein GY705_18415 [Bacteroidetes bacterium]|nr:hypothetical protein [Bacteroidota bacterium]
MTVSKRVLLISFICLLAAPAFAENIQVVAISFYSERIEFMFSDDLILNKQIATEEQSMLEYYNALEGTAYQMILDQFEHQRIQLQLNDWLYFQLMYQTIESILNKYSSLQKTLTCWFLLTKAGFDTRLSYHDGEAFLNVFSQDELFEVPMIEESGRTFINISSLLTGKGKQKVLYLLNFAPNIDGKAFSFVLRELPNFRPVPTSRTLEFYYNNDWYRMQISADRNLIDIMNLYPFIAENEYFEIPLSGTLATTLLPKLRKLISNKSDREALELLVAFTRSAFTYKDDKDYFGHSKPMIAEEVFHYPYSDCEDRSALFFILVKELLDLPMIVIAYEDHLTIGVAMAQGQGDAIHFNDKKYYICDPTGPVNSSIIGKFPPGYANRPFEIIGQYNSL